jgi:hypothetical protein
MWGNRGVTMTGSQLFTWAIAVVVAVGQVLTWVEPASAGTPISVPGPLVGAGLPGLAVVGGVYGAIWLTRKLRSRRPTR